MRKRKEILLPGLAIAISLLIGCSSTQPPCDQSWLLDGDKVKHYIETEYAGLLRKDQPFTDEQAYAEHHAKMLALRKSAELVLEVNDAHTMKLLASKLDVSFPKNEFPIADLEKYLTARRHKPIRLVIITTGDFFDFHVIAQIDRILCKAGAKERMVQSEHDMYIMEIHSGP